MKKVIFLGIVLLFLSQTVYGLSMMNISPKILLPLTQPPVNQINYSKNLIQDGNFQNLNGIQGDNKLEFGEEGVSDTYGHAIDNVKLFGQQPSKKQTISNDQSETEFDHDFDYSPCAQNLHDLQGDCTSQESYDECNQCDDQNDLQESYDECNQCDDQSEPQSQCCNQDKDNEDNGLKIELQEAKGGENDGAVTIALNNVTGQYELTIDTNKEDKQIQAKQIEKTQMTQTQTSINETTQTQTSINETTPTETLINVTTPTQTSTNPTEISINATTPTTTPTETSTQTITTLYKAPNDSAQNGNVSTSEVTTSSQTNVDDGKTYKIIKTIKKTITRRRKTATTQNS